MSLAVERSHMWETEHEMAWEQSYSGVQEEFHAKHIHLILLSIFTAYCPSHFCEMKVVETIIMELPLLLL